MEDIYEYSYEVIDKGLCREITVNRHQKLPPEKWYAGKIPNTVGDTIERYRRALKLACADLRVDESYYLDKTKIS